MTIKNAIQSTYPKLFPIRYQSVKIVLRKKAKDNLERGKKKLPLQPANEETRIAGKFIKGLEKAKREKKRF